MKRSSILGVLLVLSLPIAPLVNTRVIALDPIGRLTGAGLEIDTTKVSSFENSS